MAIVINGQTGIDAGHLPISNAGNTEVEGTFTGVNATVNSVTAGSIFTQGQNVSPFSGFKNYIINGNFDVWQRGTSFTGLTNGSYSADRWVVYDSAGDTNYNVIRNAGVFTGGYGAQYTWNSGTGPRSIIQFIENVTKFKVGSQVTISFEAYTTSTPYTIGVSIKGIRGNWVASTPTVSSTAISITNTKTKYSVTLSVPDWTSLNIDWTHLEDTKLALKFDFGADTNGKNFIIGNVQLEEGSVATPFENRPYGLELSLCQRYYESSYSGGVYPASASTLGAKYSITSSTSTAQGFTFIEPKRVPPTVTIYSPSGTAGYVWNNTDVDNGSAASYNISTKGVRYLNNSINNWTANSGIMYHYTASAEL